MPRPLPTVLRAENPTILQLGCGVFQDANSTKYSVTLDIDPKALEWLASVAVSRHQGTLNVNFAGILVRLQAEQL